jgi:hypothetical protein
MPVNKLNIALTPVQVAAIQTAIDALNVNVPFGLNLTKQERTELPNIQDERYAFVTKVIDNYAPVHPTLVSGFAGTLTEARTDFELYRQLEPFIEQLRSVTEMYQDTQQVAGTEAYTFSREFYGTAQRAAENNVPGTDAIVDDLGQLFEQSPPPPPPPPPTP